MVDDGDGRLFEVAEAEPAEKAAAGAAKKFRVYDQGQSFLLPPSLDDWLAEATRRGLCPRPSMTCWTSPRSTRLPSPAQSIRTHGPSVL